MAAKQRDNAQIILDDVLKQLHSERASTMGEAEYFEVFCAEQLLKDYDLSYDEIEAGIVDGEHDGGVDAIFSFVNGELVGEDFDPTPFKKDVLIDLFLMQSKTGSSFSEGAIDKLIAITRNLLDLSRDVDSLTQYNEQVRARVKWFRDAYRALAARFPTLTISYYLAGKRPNVPIPPNFKIKSNDLRDAASEHFPSAKISVEILGAAELMDLARRQPKRVFELKCIKSLGADQGSIVLTRLSDFNRFLRDDSGKVRKGLFESNVRDFQGATEVNAAIRNTLDKEVAPDFWWLNNGVTILSSQSTITGDVVSIAEPQIVNGLQTSTQIYQHFDGGGEESDARSVMVKILSSDDEETRDKIIKATNSQNAVQPATLRATDKIQRDIEATLKASGLYYDRRKNFYKNEGKPADKIISIPLMAQVLMSVILERPDDARARPSSLIKDDSVYHSLFSEQTPIQVYVFCGILIKRIESQLRSTPSLSARDINNVRFYVAVYLVWTLTANTNPTVADIAPLDANELTDDRVNGAIQIVVREYTRLGATDQVAKGQELKKAVRSQALLAGLLG